MKTLLQHSSREQSYCEGKQAFGVHRQIYDRLAPNAIVFRSELALWYGEKLDYSLSRGIWHPKSVGLIPSEKCQQTFASTGRQFNQISSRQKRTVLALTPSNKPYNEETAEINYHDLESKCIGKTATSN